MRLNRKGMTGMMDAMIFISVMTLVFAGLYVTTLERETDNGAMIICDYIEQTKVEACSILDSGDDRVLPLTDIMAYSLTSGTGEVNAILTELASSIVHGGQIYMLEYSCNGHSELLGHYIEMPNVKCTRTYVTSLGYDLTITVAVC